MTLTNADAGLLALIQALARRSYHFVTPTPATHARVVARPDRREGRSLEDVLGWSLPFEPALLDAELMALLEHADALEPAGEGRLRSRYRVSSLHSRLFVHSAYPTEAKDAVFFGPDSYRFADLIAAELPGCELGPDGHVVDIGTGAGVGAIVAAGLCPGARVTMTDLNPAALRLARVNAQAAGVAAETVEGADLERVDGSIDVALANPPYIIDSSGRDYRDGGGMLGGQVAFDMTRMAAERLAPGGRVILYTGSTIVRGRDLLQEALVALAAERGMTLRYREIDPDVFGEELDEPAYASADRIALVAAVLQRS
jgi:methylase of polypeptide subunit release factors